MQSCQFAKSVIERGSGKFSAARPAAVSSVELQYSRSRPCSLCFLTTVRCWQWFAVVRLSWSSQILLRHVLDLRTPLPRQGNVTDSFISVCSVHSFCASCERVWPYVLPATAGVSFISLYCLYYSVSVGRHSVFLSCLFVVGVRIYYYFRGKACDMFIHFRVIFFTCVTARPEGL